MALKIRLFELQDECSEPTFVGTMSCPQNDTYANLRVLLCEHPPLLEFFFDFWDNESKCRMKSRFERYNNIGTEVFVIRAECTKRLCVGNSAPQNEANAEQQDTPASEEPMTSSDEGDVQAPDQTSAPTSASAADELKSVLVSKEVMVKYLMCREVEEGIGTSHP